MAATSVREMLIEKLDVLTDEQVAALLSIVRAFETNEEREISSEEYDPDNDPAIGFITGPTDFARRAEEILYEDIKPKSGWTQKGDE